MRKTRVDGEELGRLVAGAAPAVSDPTAGEVDRVWNVVSTQLGDGPVRPRSRIRLAVGAGIAAAVLGTGGVAAADFYSARTGQGPADAEDLLLGGPGEKLDPAGSDLAEVFAEEAKDIPFPTAAARQQTIDFWVDDLTRDNPAPRTSGLSTGALRAWMASDAVCFWANQWAASTRAGDDTARAEAVSKIAAADSWPAVTALDPKPSTWLQTVTSEDEAGDRSTEQVRQDSHFYYLSRVAHASEGADLDAMATALRSGGRGCWSYQVPDLPMADPMYAEEHGRAE